MRPPDEIAFFVKNRVVRKKSFAVNTTNLASVTYRSGVIKPQMCLLRETNYCHRFRGVTGDRLDRFPGVVNKSLLQ